MTEQTKHTPKSLEFIQFWMFIAQELGNSRLKINPRARDIHNILDPNNDSKDFLKTSITESYKRSCCNNLQSKISINAVLDILGETAFQLRNNHSDDLFDIELLEEIAWHINDRYRQYICVNAQPISKSTGQVISFPGYKIRLANTRH